VLVGLGLGLCVVWLDADSIDGMISRATRKASGFGRELDGSQFNLKCPASDGG
jgi:hypothetical protein